jgi:hypothetical protein
VFSAREDARPTSLKKKRRPEDFSPLLLDLGFYFKPAR